MSRTSHLSALTVNMGMLKPIGSMSMTIALQVLYIPADHPVAR
jgi:hypothetical protein